MFKLSPELKAKGEQAEAAFRAWLNQSGVAFLYVEQSPLNVPDKMRGKIKRPDYIVGIPYTGCMAFDVKAKTAYDEHLIFELGEVDKLARFGAHFHMSLYFACFDLDAPDRFYWVALRDLIGRTPERRGKARVVTIPTAEAFEVSFDLSLLDAHIAFSAHCLAV